MKLLLRSGVIVLVCSAPALGQSIGNLASNVCSDATSSSWTCTIPYPSNITPGSVLLLCFTGFSVNGTNNPVHATDSNGVTFYPGGGTHQFCDEAINTHSGSDTVTVTGLGVANPANQIDFINATIAEMQGVAINPGTNGMCANTTTAILNPPWGTSYISTNQSSIGGSGVTRIVINYLIGTTGGYAQCGSGGSQGNCINTYTWSPGSAYNSLATSNWHFPSSTYPNIPGSYTMLETLNVDTGLSAPLLCDASYSVSLSNITGSSFPYYGSQGLASLVFAPPGQCGAPGGVSFQGQVVHLHWYDIIPPRLSSLAVGL